MQAINDTEKRTQIHLEGKLHTGFAVLRRELEKLRKRKEEIKGELQTLLPQEFHNPTKKIQEASGHYRPTERSRTVQTASTVATTLLIQQPQLHKCINHC